MEFSPSCLSCPPAYDIGFVKEEEEERGKLLQIDPFLVEALENPRHRLTVLRMELDIQRFMQSSDQYQFEFQHFSTSYLRCAAHRVAQHYGLQTLVVDTTGDGSCSRIAARKTPESRYPSILLSDIPTILPKKEEKGKVRIVTRPRASKTFRTGAVEPGAKVILRTVEERKEEYNKARARIFNDSFISDAGSAVAADGKTSLLSGDEKDENEDLEKQSMKDAAGRVAVFRDIVKDRSDPDYDRSYDRYARGFVHFPNYAIGTCNIPLPSHSQYEGAFSQLSYRPSEQSAPSKVHAVGCNQTSPGVVYMQWPTPAMLYAHSYEHFRHAVFQPPVYQQPLSFDHLQNS
ncbi:hypothetical protein AXF42_Ash004637 [Apostasia shenzhenica]|uniref:R3H domain-containing protein 2 n=1 Tax=Apostasia shenzhenica TaxID=1088818 RepID=A0A2I0BH76_9ASPA|nr:hypothetical protein AXF42_Ash004637 [Apostasia shenzhenica]